MSSTIGCQQLLFPRPESSLSTRELLSEQLVGGVEAADFCTNRLEILEAVPFR